MLGDGSFIAFATPESFVASFCGMVTRVTEIYTKVTHAATGPRDIDGTLTMVRWIVGRAL